MHWNSEETEYLQRNAEGLSLGEISKHLGRSKQAVYRKARSLGFKVLVTNVKGRTRRRWTRNEELKLLGMAVQYSISAAARKLGRSEVSVAKKAYAMGLSFRERRLLIDDVAKILGVHKATIRRRRDKLGLKFRVASGEVTRNQSASRGATGADIVAIAQDILRDPPMKDIKVTVKHLKAVIEEYKDWE